MTHVCVFLCSNWLPAYLECVNNETMETIREQWFLLYRKKNITPYWCQFLIGY